MNYFKQTEKLLNEPDFLKFASGEYHEFIRLDDNEYMQFINEGETFYMNLKRWNNVCKNEKTRRFFQGGSGYFLLYARVEAQKLVYNDWNYFKKTTETSNGKALNSAINEFLGEAEEVRATIALRQYLEPLRGWLIEVLDSIDSHYKNQVSSRTRKSIDMGEQQPRTKLKWRGGASALCALFLDLRTAQMKKTEDKYLSIGDADLVQFIMDNFEFRNSDNTVETISQASIKRYVDGKDISQRIKLDLSGLKK